MRDERDVEEAGDLTFDPEQNWIYLCVSADLDSRTLLTLYAAQDHDEAELVVTEDVFWTFGDLEWQLVPGPRREVER